MDSFEHFGIGHISFLAAITLIVIFAALISRKADEKATISTLRVLAVNHLVLELIQDAMLFIGDDWEIRWLLPLHLCNIGIFVNLAAAFTKGRARTVFSEISVMLIMPGSIGALLFPDWNYRAITSPVSILCFTTHALLLLIPILMITKKICDIRLPHIIFPIGFLAVTTPPIYLIDKSLGVNYMFLQIPSDDSPLSFIYDIFSAKYYVAGLFLLVTSILLIEYLIAFLIRTAVRHTQV